jgi:hypothetical protein
MAVSWLSEIGFPLKIGRRQPETSQQAARKRVNQPLFNDLKYDRLTIRNHPYQPVKSFFSRNFSQSPF